MRAAPFRCMRRDPGYIAIAPNLVRIYFEMGVERYNGTNYPQRTSRLFAVSSIYHGIHHSKYSKRPPNRSPTLAPLPPVFFEIVLSTITSSTTILTLIALCGFGGSPPAWKLCLESEESKMPCATQHCSGCSVGCIGYGSFC